MTNSASSFHLLIMDCVNIDTAGIALFLNIASAGSLSAAARKLGITPMVATRRLATLEEQLGVRLVQRTTRSVSLTPEGETFLPFATTMLEAAEEGRALITTSQTTAHGLLRVTASGSMGRFIIMPLLPKLLGENTNLRVELHLSDTLVDIVSTGIDVAIRTGELKDSTLIATSLGTNDRILCAAPSYLARKGTPKLLSDLAKHDCIVPTGHTQWPFLVDGEEHLVRVAGRVTVSNFDGVRDACIVGAGISMLSTWHADADLLAGMLVKITLEDAALKSLPVWAVYPTKRQVLPKVKVFVNEVRRTLAENRKRWSGSAS